jgi:putative phage-type endonuclease
MKDFARFEKYLLPESMNNDPNLLEYRIPKNIEDWHEFRRFSIGASEVAVVLGQNPYQIFPSMIEEKIGIKETRRSMNESMMSGLLAEEGILKRWSYHDGTDTNYVENYMNGNVIRKYEECDSYIVNVEYPWLFASLDGKALKGQQFLGTGQVINKMFPIECKTIKHFESKKWLDGVPSMYRYQINTQMLVTNTDVAELAVLEDGYSFRIEPFKRDDAACELILSETYQAYELMQYLLGLHNEIKKERSVGNIKVAQELEVEFLNKLPLPGDQDGFSEYYSEKMLAESESFLGDANDSTLASISSKLRLAGKIIDKEQKQIDNLIKRSFVLNQGEYMDLGKNGKLRYYVKGGRVNHELSFTSYKSGYDEAKVKEMIKNLLD